MVKKTDLRVIKTKNLIYNTLIELMKDKTFEEIKVSEICSRALVNRSTFYAHYEDKYEFLVDFLDTFKDSLTSYLDTNDNNLNTKEYYMEMLKLLLTHIEDKKNIYSAIMVNNRNGVMMDIISDDKYTNLKVNYCEYWTMIEIKEKDSILGLNPTIRIIEREKINKLIETLEKTLSLFEEIQNNQIVGLHTK